MNTTTIVNEESPRVHLPFDILVYVALRIAERKDLLSFISTCSDLYHTSVPTLLGFHHCITKTNLVAFHEFLVSKSPSSFLGLRSLDLHFPENVDGRIRPNEVTVITDILDHAKKLQEIAIYGRVMGSGASVYRALAALPALHVLQLGIYDDFKAGIPATLIPATLARLQSPLVSLGFKLHGEDLDIVTALSHFRHTLERLNVSDIALYKVATTDFRYSNMTVLELVSVSNMRLSILVPAFPNLKHLTVKYADDFPDEEVDDLRTDNLQFQQEHPDQMWRLLSLTGDVASLYVVASQTVVHQVSITCLGIYGCPLAIGILKAVLTPLQPLSLSMDELDESVVEMGWLSKEVVQCYELVRLDLELTFEDTRSIYENQNRLVSFLQNFLSKSNVIL